MKALTYESKIEKKKQIQQKNMNNKAEDENETKFHGAPGTKD